MRPEFKPLPADDPEIVAYRDALLKAGVGIETTEEDLERACQRVTNDHACITSDVIAACPQIINLIVHGGFEDAKGRVILVLPRDRETLRTVRDVVFDVSSRALAKAIEDTAARIGLPLGPRSALTLRRWYTIFPAFHADAKARRRESTPSFDRNGKIAEEVGGDGHLSGRVSKKTEHARIDIPDPASLGLSEPCFLSAYLTGKTSTSEVRPGSASVDGDRCYLDRLPHDHKWKPFWAYVPDYSESRHCALLTGDRCVADVKFKATGRKQAEGESKGSCSETRNVRVSKAGKAVLLPQPPKDWRHYDGLEPQKGHVHLWQGQHTHWSGSHLFPVKFFACVTCDAEAWPNAVRPVPGIYRNYGPAVDKVVKAVRFPREVRTAFVKNGDNYVGPGTWEKPAGITKQFNDAVEKTQKEFSKEIEAFTKETAKIGKKKLGKAPLSVFLGISESVAKEHGRRWKPPTWVVEAEVDAVEEHVDEESEEDDS